MKLFTVFLGLLFLSTSTFADHKIKQYFDEGEIFEGHISLFLDNGEIVHISKDEKESVVNAKNAFRNYKSFSFDRISTSHEKADSIKNIKVIDTAARTDLVALANNQNKEMYTYQGHRAMKFQTRDPLEHSNITLLPSYAEAQKVMDTFNGETDKDSQCYNRAHMWSYESLVNREAVLGKIWIFFTKKYIREFRYKWWFHIAPITHVNDSNKIYVLDRGFTMIPYNVKNWKNLYMKNKAECPVITDYRQYSRNQYSEHCYIMYSSQYYWQPWQLESLSKKGINYWGYKQRELQITYKDALTSWYGAIPILPAITTPIRREEIVAEEVAEETEIEEEVAEEEETSSRENSLVSSFSTGEIVINIAKDYALAMIQEVRPHYTIGFLTGRHTGREGTNWKREDLAQVWGCYEGLCVGDTVKNLKSNNALTKIIAIQFDGLFVIEFLTGEHTGKTGGNWSHNSLNL